MPTETQEIETLANREYKWGFITDIEADPPRAGLNEEIVRFISMKKGEPEWMLGWRLKAYRHWLTMDEPTGRWFTYPPIDYQKSIYYSAPKPKLKSLDEVDPELLKTYEKLGIPLAERAASGRRRGRCGLRQRFGRHDVQETSRGKGNHLLLVWRSRARASGSGAAIHGIGRSLLATITSPRSTRRSSPMARSSTSPRA